MSQDERKLDKRQARRSFSKAASRYNDHAFLQNEIGGRLFEHLDLMTIEPQAILDLGAGTGIFSSQLMKKYPHSRVTAVDFSEAMLQQIHQPRWRKKVSRVCGDAETLPFKDAGVDLIFSNLMLQWCQPDRSFAEARRALSSEGLILFSTLGPDTLKELRQVSRSIDGVGRVHEFIDMHDIGDALIRAGFTEPVMEMETITVQYTSVLKLMRDLRGIGASNALNQRRRGLMGKKAMKMIENQYVELFACDGKIPATYEVIYGHAWVGKTAMSKNDSTGLSYFSVSDLSKI